VRDEILASSNPKQRQQNTSQEAFSQKYVVNTQGAESQGPSFGTAQAERTTPETRIGLLEKMLERENMFQALHRVQRNQGAPGIDGMTVKDLTEHIKANWISIKEEILKGTYKPKPVRRVEIPKPGGGIRLLGIPTVVDRLIQQALTQVLTPIFDPEFSPYSYGFRPGKRAHDAVRKAQEYIQQGNKVVVDTDLAQFFDRVNHDILMAKIARKVKDKRILKLIRTYLESGILINGVVTTSEEGTPQGGPISPLLANIMLDDFDWELTRRGHKFVRYADDCNIYVKSFRAGQRVLNSITQYLEGKLKLKVNQEKSAVDRPWKRKFLGFSFYIGKQVRIRLAPKTIERLKGKIKEMTQRSQPIPLDRRVQRISQYLKGWLGYFAIADAKNILKELDTWIRHRLRMCVWKQWKKPKTRIREFRAHGAPEWLALGYGNTRKGPWAASLLLNSVLTNEYWQKLGLFSLMDRYLVIRSA
jgi:RNA-directed DNA polymerase